MSYLGVVLTTPSYEKTIWSESATTSCVDITKVWLLNMPSDQYVRDGRGRVVNTLGDRDVIGTLYFSRPCHITIMMLLAPNYDINMISFPRHMLGWVRQSEEGI